MARNDDKRELPPLLVVSSEGSAMYGTTDLATILDRKRYFDPEQALYVVDQRQADHFEVVFRAAYLAGYAAEGALEHVGFGTMNGPDGKPFKTRAGGVLKLRDLIEMTSDKARERLHEAGLGAELPPEEFEATALKVAVAALKFADLSNFRGTSYVFDLDRFSSFEGKTGPYLLYQAVRVKSLLRRAAEEGAAPGRSRSPSRPSASWRWRSTPSTTRWPRPTTRRRPHFLAEHAYRLASAFSRFYAACPILAAPPAVRASRLAPGRGHAGPAGAGAGPAGHRGARADVVGGRADVTGRRRNVVLASMLGGVSADGAQRDIGWDRAASHGYSEVLVAVCLPGLVPLGGWLGGRLELPAAGGDAAGADWPRLAAGRKSRRGGGHARSAYRLLPYLYIPLQLAMIAGPVDDRPAVRPTLLRGDRPDPLLRPHRRRVRLPGRPRDGAQPPSRRARAMVS